VSGEAEQFVVDVDPNPAGVSVAVAGELDLRTAPLLVDRTVAAVDWAGPAELTLDLADVTFCDSAGISALVQLRRRCEENGWQFRIVNPQPQVRRILVNFTGLGEYLNVGS
jgi:anti-sigma B factor antagonist